MIGIGSGARVLVGKRSFSPTFKDVWASLRVPAG
jgi:hypothetical protein